MRTRFVYFIIFQIIAWTFYFHWDNPSNQESVASKKLIRVSEISAGYVKNALSNNPEYKLILRNDGFFTRFNADRTEENGLWKMDYEDSSIILISAQGEYHYRILEEIDDLMEVRPVKSDELARNEDGLDRDRLFSSSSLN